jgi:hypothetical protein
MDMFGVAVERPLVRDFTPRGSIGAAGSSAPDVHQAANPRRSIYYERPIQLSTEV